MPPPGYSRKKKGAPTTHQTTEPKNEPPPARLLIAPPYPVRILLHAADGEQALRLGVPRCLELGEPAAGLIVVRQTLGGRYLSRRNQFNGEFLRIMNNAHPILKG